MDYQEENVKREYLASFIVAYVISIKSINQLLGVILGRSDGIMIINLIVVCGLIALHFFMSGSGSMNLNKKSLLFVYYIVSVIVISKYAYRYASVTYEEIFVYVLIPLYLSFYKIDVEKILQYLVFFSALIIPFSGAFFESTVTSAYETIGMTTTYNILLFILSAALHFWYYRKNAGVFMWIGYLINIYYLFLAIVYGNRGFMISLLVFGIFLILHKVTPDGTINKNNTKKYIFTIVVGVVIGYVINNFEEILRGVDSWLNSMNIEISAISKSIQKLDSNDLSNGREQLFEFAKRGISEHPIIGNGIATTLHNSFYKIAYPHNLFLQLWYEMGIIVSLPMFYLIGKATIKTALDSSLGKNTTVLMILLYTLSIPRLCYSSQLWMDIPFWFLLMYTITPNIYEDIQPDEKEV